ncbi:RNA exonuclease 5 [Nephila pilipes]|uniref:RNA exonuclease 5 n=1 Tax=Nephila pilipes TaxID=299642 RepID=A0A8X6PL45_NEPPI|nr:RNA exonuclease 5 [Nephila pilipes]
MLRKRKITYYSDSDSEIEGTEHMTPEEKKNCKERFKILEAQFLPYAYKFNFPKAEPEFNLNRHGKDAEVIINDCKSGRPNVIIEPVCMDDIYMAVFRSVTSTKELTTKLRWATFEQAKRIKKTLLLVIEGFSKSDILDNILKLNNVDIFEQVVETVSSNTHFATELSTLHLITDFHMQNKDTYSTMFPKEKGVKIEIPLDDKLPSKLNLLLSPIQMVMEYFPLPACNYKKSKSDNYIFTKESYYPVTKNSPMFALDCEMCESADDSSELTRIAVVNENCDIVYHTLVKPDKKITNYLTKFSGVTEYMLKDVTVQLSDVQQHLQKLLPADAILVGHSLNCDLHALKMIHPYVIDTSIIFNNSGIRGYKDALKKLALKYLDKVIQNSDEGHTPMEDAVTTMELVKFKLQDISKTAGQYFCSQRPSSFGENSLNYDNKSSVLNFETNFKIYNTSFFSRIAKFSKKCALIGNETSLKYYDKNILTDIIEENIKSNREDIVKTTLKQIKNKDLIISHLNYDQTSKRESLEELNVILKQLYDVCEDRYMFMVLISGVDENNYSDIKSGLFMSVLKISDLEYER